MALATQCPHCQTTFRVAHDQLKLRAGLVRCGACKQIFNGIENLLHPEGLEQAIGATHMPPSSAAGTAPPVFPPDTASRIPPRPAETETNAALPETPPVASSTGGEDALMPSEPAAPPAASEDGIQDDPLLRMTLMDFTHARREPADGDGAELAMRVPDPLDRVMEDLERKPWRTTQDTSSPAETDALDQADSADFEEPNFVRQGRRRQRIGRMLRIFMASSSAILLAGLLGQSAYVFRNQIAAWFPQAAPVLAEACARLGCQLGLPAQIESVSIESSELQVLAADSNTFTLTVLLRNHGATPQAWPHIELTLNDVNEKAIARRVFPPREYLSSEPDAGKGFGAKSEQPIKLHFELAQLKASGYRVYLFYP